MKKQAENRTQTDTLPSFLDEASPAETQSELDFDTQAEADATSPDVDETAAAEDAPEDAGPADEHELSSANGVHSAGEPTPSYANKPEHASQRPARGGGTKSVLGGAALMLAGVGLGLAQARAPMPAVEQFGLTPTSLLVVGAVVVAAGSTRRHVAALQQRLDENGGQGTAGTAALQESLQILVAAQRATEDRPPAAGEELQHVPITLQRQDEKINNLTKAIKMYGKPLMEISGQATELAGAVAQVRTAVDAGNDSTRQAFVRIESQVRTSGSKQEIAELQEAIRKSTAGVEALAARVGTTPSLDPLHQQVAKVETAVQGLGKRLDDGEVHKSLQRLEDAAQKARNDVQLLLRGESVEKATANLQQRLDAATAQLAEGIGKLRTGNTNNLENAVKELQRELSGVAATVAQIQSAVKAGARASAPAAPAAAEAQSPPKAPPAPERPGTTPPAAGAASPAGDPNGYQTGTRSSNAKNVLGAIAKLKQMKT